MEGKEWEEFVEDIRKRGVREPILLHEDGRILDGRNRYNASIEAEQTFGTETFDGTDDAAVDEVLSLNLHRRHLNESQRAMVGAKMANMQRGGYTHGNRTEVNRPIGLLSQKTAAARLNVSEKSVRRARGVRESGDSNLIQEVESGAKSVSRAYDEVREKRTHEIGYRKDRVIASKEKDLIEAMDTGNISPSAAYEELQNRIRNLAVPRTNKLRKLVPIEDFIREMVRKISSVVRTGRLDAIAESGADLTEYQKRDTAIALRDMGRKMIERANELWPEETTTLYAEEYESE